MPVSEGNKQISRVPFFGSFLGKQEGTALICKGLLEYSRKNLALHVYKTSASWWHISLF